MFHNFRLSHSLQILFLLCSNNDSWGLVKAGGFQDAGVAKGGPGCIISLAWALPELYVPWPHLSPSLLSSLSLLFPPHTPICSLLSLAQMVCTLLLLWLCLSSLGELLSTYGWHKRQAPPPTSFNPAGVLSQPLGPCC